MVRRASKSRVSESRAGWGQSSACGLRCDALPRGLVAAAGALVRPGAVGRTRGGVSGARPRRGLDVAIRSAPVEFMTVPSPFLALVIAPEDGSVLAADLAGKAAGDYLIDRLAAASVAARTVIVTDAGAVSADEIAGDLLV